MRYITLNGGNNGVILMKGITISFLRIAMIYIKHRICYYCHVTRTTSRRQIIGEKDIKLI